MKKLSAMAASAVILLSSAAFAETIDTKAKIQKRADAWKDAYNNRDADALAKMYGANARYSSAYWTASGQENIRDGFKKSFGAAGAVFTSITVDQSTGIGTMNYASGTWSATMKGRDGDVVPIGGHWLSVAEQGVILVHVSNTQMPLPAAK
jgi:ketosteroid isomerase-like protein